MHIPPRRILLADADAFYVAVSRLVDPERAGRAPLLIVGGSRESRGVVCSASYETRRYGVRSAMPIARALRLCPDALCVPIPRRACAEKSRQIRSVLERFAPVVEAASVDESYLDLGGTEALYRGEPLATTAARIRGGVVEATGLSVSIGGGTSKLIAKLAVERAKPAWDEGAGSIPPVSGVHVVEPGAEGEFLQRLRLAQIPQVGPRFQERLDRLGLRTVADALVHGREALVERLGARAGAWLFDSVRGIDPDPVQPRLEPKSLSRDETFPADLDDDAELERELLALVVRAAWDLRTEGLAARTVTVRLRDRDFRTRQAGRTLREAVVTDRAIHGVAREMLAKLRAARRMPARLVGVALSSLEPDFTGLERDFTAEAQLEADLSTGAAPEESPRDRALARSVDRLRAKYGSDCVLPGTLRGK